jgi:monoamine oxidase
MQKHNPLVGGSYSYYRPGDFYRYQGTQQTKEGTVHFAGEHTANMTNTGFINGAVISGERAATELAAY